MTMINLKEIGVQYITDPTGERNAVVLPLDAFNALLEDLDDLAVAADLIVRTGLAAIDLAVVVDVPQ
jgi:hypothetical protein